MAWKGKSKLGAKVTRLTEVDLEIARLLLEAFLPHRDQTDETGSGPHTIRVTKKEGKTAADSA